eukprot:1556763-Pyramimonas_sp.AAC.1
MKLMMKGAGGARLLEEASSGWRSAATFATLTRPPQLAHCLELGEQEQRAHADRIYRRRERAHGLAGQSPPLLKPSALLLQQPADAGERARKALQ